MSGASTVNTHYFNLNTYADDVRIWIIQGPPEPAGMVQVIDSKILSSNFLTPFCKLSKAVGPKV